MYICTTCTHTSTGEPQTFTVRVSPSANYPLDLYILMDLSSSMSDELQSMNVIHVYAAILDSMIYKLFAGIMVCWVCKVSLHNL